MPDRTCLPPGVKQNLVTHGVSTISERARANVVRPTSWHDDAAKARHKEARRAQRAKRRKTPRQLLAIRISEMMRLLRHRYDHTLPSTEVEVLEALCRHLAMVPGGNPARRVSGAVEDWAPWMTLGERDTLVGRVLLRPMFYGAQRLGKKILRMTAEERKQLNIGTFRSVDGPDPKARRRRRSIERKRRIRREAGSVSRAQYLAQSKAQSKPWVAAGVSRATWYRRLSETGPATPYSLIQGEPHLSQPLSAGALSQATERKVVICTSPFVGGVS